MTSERGHTLTIVETEHHTTEDPDYDFDVTCLDPASCGGWQECSVDRHEIDGVDAGLGPYDGECPGEHGVSTDRAGHWAWCDEEEVDFHGVLHTWHYGWGWTVPFPGCVVGESDGIWDTEWDIARTHGPGVWRVDDEWFDETSCELIAIDPPPNKEAA